MLEIVYKVLTINGDYVTAVSESGDTTDIALALLPPETDEGDTVIFKDFEYSLLK